LSPSRPTSLVTDRMGTMKMETEMQGTGGEGLAMR
jgi:hypothetical protein